MQDDGTIGEFNQRFWQGQSLHTSTHRRVSARDCDAETWGITEK